MPHFPSKQLNLSSLMRCIHSPCVYVRLVIEYRSVHVEGKCGAPSIRMLVLSTRSHKNFVTSKCMDYEGLEDLLRSGLVEFTQFVQATPFNKMFMFQYFKAIANFLLVRAAETQGASSVNPCSGCSTVDSWK